VREAYGFCPWCGTKRDDARFCTSCGKPFDEVASEPRGRLAGLKGVNAWAVGLLLAAVTGLVVFIAGYAAPRLPLRDVELAWCLAHPLELEDTADRLEILIPLEGNGSIEFKRVCRAAYENRRSL
jgi:hypothetical protein